jgi:NAD(P)-dependent dehydrogenase (short-subunit alcohol dehydrogenase family)
MTSLPARGAAIVIGASGGIGAAVADRLDYLGRFDAVVRLSRLNIDITNEASVAAATVAYQGKPIRLVFVATGLLKGQGASPEKGWRDLDADALATVFAVNTIGPALILKHFLPLLPRDGKSVCALLSARVGSIGDNRLGGWYGYRAAKAALNQMVRSAAIELARIRPEAICVSLHPGTVATPLSAPFVKAGLDVQSPALAAERLISVIDGLTPADTGGFFDHLGQPIPW